MGVISFRFKYQFACFATANHLLNKQLLYLCAVPHFPFKLCVCFTPNSLLWSIINNFAESRALRGGETTCYLGSTRNRRPLVSYHSWQWQGDKWMLAPLSDNEIQQVCGRTPWNFSASLKTDILTWEVGFFIFSDDQQMHWRRAILWLEHSILSHAMTSLLPPPTRTAPGDAGPQCGAFPRGPTSVSARPPTH